MPSNQPVSAPRPPVAACPWLPTVDEALDFTVTRRHGTDRGAAYYRDALRFAQSQWRSAKPAQAILQLDKAWLADLADDDPVLATHPPPYHALVWLLRRAADGSCGYLGDPVRHFQHLASRVSGPRATVRAWRAWTCLHLAERTLPGGRFARDGRQLAREGLWLPSPGACLAALARHGWRGEAAVAQSAAALGQ